MRLRPRAAALLGLVAVLATSVGWASPAHADTKESARRHLKLGVALFQESNWAGALVEFEASFREHPSASALQNVALCQSKLFRYVDALASLERLQHEFGDTLSDSDAMAVREAQQNLEQLVGTLVVNVSPASAQITVQGRPLSADERTRPVRLSSGEYRIGATAPGHAPAELVVKIAGGDQKTVSLSLNPEQGRLHVLLKDPAATIAVDRHPLGASGWSGMLTPGVHVVQVLKRGHAPFSTQLSVRSGDRVELRLPVGAPLTEGEPDASAATAAGGLPYEEGSRTGIRSLSDEIGWYGLVTATSIAVLASPDRFEASDDADAVGGTFGLRAGYRISALIGVEGAFDAGAQSVAGVHEEFGPQTYDLTARRLGGNVRFLFGGTLARLSATLGVGGVYHRLELAGTTYAGTNSYMGLELGPQFNVGQLLLEAAAQAYFEGANNAKSGDTRAYTKHGIVPMVGVGLRIGYSQWGRW